MAAYVIIQVNVTDEERYGEYKKMTPATLERYGGRFLVRGGAAEDLEGARSHSRVVLLEFDSMESAKTWYDSPEYQEAKSVRAGAGDAVFTALEGVPPESSLSSDDAGVSRDGQ